MVICLERGADLHMAQLMPLPLTVSLLQQNPDWFSFLIPAHPGSPEKGPLNVCVCVHACVRACVSVCVCVHVYWSTICWLLRWSIVEHRRVNAIFCAVIDRVLEGMVQLVRVSWTTSNSLYFFCMCKYICDCKMVAVIYYLFLIWICYLFYTFTQIIDILIVWRRTKVHGSVFIAGPAGNRNDSSYKPSFLTDQELKHLVLEVLWSSYQFSDEVICLMCVWWKNSA